MKTYQTRINKENVIDSLYISESFKDSWKFATDVNFDFENNGDEHFPDPIYKEGKGLSPTFDRKSLQYIEIVDDISKGITANPDIRPENHFSDWWAYTAGSGSIQVLVQNLTNEWAYVIMFMPSSYMTLPKLLKEKGWSYEDDNAIAQPPFYLSPIIKIISEEPYKEKKTPGFLYIDNYGILYSMPYFARELYPAEDWHMELSTIHDVRPFDTDIHIRIKRDDIYNHDQMKRIKREKEFKQAEKEGRVVYSKETARKK